MKRFAISLAVCLTCANAAHAAVAFVQPTWARPTTTARASSSLATYQRWDVFTSVTANAPDVAAINPNGSANAFDANAPGSGTIVTSTGNLYAGSGIIRMNVVVPNYAAAAERTRFLLQIKTIGSALFDTDGVWPSPPVETDFSRLTLNGEPVDALVSFVHTQLAVSPGSGPTSFDVERSIAFDVPGNAAGYTFEWTTARGSCSQMEISVDTIVVVPEPMLLAGALPLVLVRRRR